MVFFTNRGIIPLPAAPGGVQAWDPANKSANITLSGSDLVATGGSSSTENVRGLIGLSAGKVYWEVIVTTHTSSTGYGMGFCDSTFVLGEGGAGTICFQFADQNAYEQGGASCSTLPGGPFATGTIVSIALDIGTTPPNVWFRRDGGQWTNTGDPAAGTSPATPIAATYNLPLYPVLDLRTSGAVLTSAFTSASWTYAAPSGFGPWV